jgi:hypothetical protein
MDEKGEFTVNNEGWKAARWQGFCAYRRMEGLNYELYTMRDAASHLRFGFFILKG